MVSEPCGRGAGVLSPQRMRPLQRPAVSSKAAAALRLCPQGAVNQGGTTEVCYAPSLSSVGSSRTGAFFMHPSKALSTELCRAGRSTFY